MSDHIGKYLAQVAETVIPDLELLERMKRKEVGDWTADQIAGRIKILKSSIKAMREGKQ